ncbi:MAG: SusC/RagA family TonB-linked outer membrane protein [Bacteroidetes bacterium]|nr:SusC/RagA family TonB-linked outer membrane protein [Bacteroidota bacterium]
MRNLNRTIAGWIILCLLPALAFSQNKTISGNISDPSGHPIQGASIIIKQTSHGTVSDAEGNFTLSASARATIVISSAGFISQSFKADDWADNNRIVLKEDIAHLDEVVVTGLATTVKRRNLANAVATISSKELNGGAPAQTFDAALEGKISGASINANSGAPGGGISVKLRGTTSIFGNTQPLYVVDGVYVDNTSTSAGLNAVTAAAPGGAVTSTQDNPSSRIADLRAEDIENIEILKGASAAAIYGSKAAAGVIIITTKKGKAGRTKISVSQDIGAITARHLLGVRQYNADRAASRGADAADSARLRQDFLDAQAAGHIYNYEKEVYGNTGFARNTVLSVSGGTANTGVYFSASQKDEGGIVKNTGYRNSSLRLNIDHRINDNIKIGISTNYVNSSADRGLTGNDNVGASFGVALSSTPDFAQLHPDARGDYPANPFGTSNPLQTIAQMTNNESVNRFITGINLEALLQKNDKSNTRFIARGGVDFYNLSTTALFPGTLQFQAVNKGTSIEGGTTNLNTNYTLSLVNTFTASDKLSFTTSAGLTQETGDYKNLINVATQVISGQSNVDQAGALNATELKQKYVNQGLFIQEEANINDLFSVTGGVRFDRSSNNGDVAKYYVYPKAGVSWNLTKMGILKDGIVDNLKLRVAYGQANNVPVYGSKFTSFGISNISGFPGLLIGSREGRADIKPERQAELETGIDISLLKGRLGFVFTYYNKTIQDFLLLNALPSSSGFFSQWLNAGDLRNRGVELGMTARPIQTKNLVWNTSVNFWLNRSKVTRLSIPSVPTGGFGTGFGTFQIQEGRSATQIVGLDGSGNVVQLGDAEPTFQMNTYNEITFFEKLSLRFLLHWKQGGRNVNLTQILNDLGGTSPDYDKVTNKQNIPDGEYRAGLAASDARPFVQNSGYVRLREIGLYYSFTHLPINYIKGLRVGVSLNNFFTATKYKGYDPEVSNFGTGLSSGVDVDPYPSSKRADFHISLDF